MRVGAFLCSLGALWAASALAEPSADEVAAEPYFLDGVREYESGNFQAAHDAFARCLQLSATRTDCMTNVRCPTLTPNTHRLHGECALPSRNAQHAPTA